MDSNQPNKVETVRSDSSNCADTAIDRIIQIHNLNSNLFQFYEFSVPFSLTVEECNVSSNSFAPYRVSPGQF